MKIFWIFLAALFLIGATNPSAPYFYYEKTITTAETVTFLWDTDGDGSFDDSKSFPIVDVCNENTSNAIYVNATSTSGVQNAAVVNAADPTVAPTSVKIPPALSATAWTCLPFKFDPARQTVSIVAAGGGAKVWIHARNAR